MIVAQQTTLRSFPYPYLRPIRIFSGCVDHTHIEANEGEVGEAAGGLMELIDKSCHATNHSPCSGKMDPTCSLRNFHPEM
jgi:hypothetical protein